MKRKLKHKKNLKTKQIMNCNEFKSKVVDLFDTHVDKATREACLAHMDSCPSCKEYYEELKMAFTELEPHKTFNVSLAVSQNKPHRRLWQTAAAVIVCLMSFVLGWSHLFTSEARAGQTTPFTLTDGMKCVQNVGSFRIVAYARTTPKENFAYFDPKADFVKVSISLMRQNDSTFFRVEKEGGRTVVCDGTNQYMWTGDGAYNKEGRDADFLESFNSLLYPERLLKLQDQVVYLSEKNREIRTETDSTIIITVEGKQLSGELNELFTKGKERLVPVVIRNVFSKNDGLLRSVNVTVNNVVILKVVSIQYNVIMNKKNIVALPNVPSTKWEEMKPQPIEKRLLARLQHMSAEEAAQAMMDDLCNGKAAANPAFRFYKPYLPKMTREFAGCRASNFTAKKKGDYAGLFVFYLLTRPNGKTEKSYICVRNDNDQHIWIADGGL